MVIIGDIYLNTTVAAWEAVLLLYGVMGISDTKTSKHNQHESIEAYRDMNTQSDLLALAWPPSWRLKYQPASQPASQLHMHV